MIKKLIRLLSISVLAIILLALPTRLNSLTKAPDQIGEPAIIISEYDRVFQKVAYETGVDWHLLSAIAYTESRYQSGLRSRKGAIGLMQIMPSTARHFDVSVEFLDDPLMNVTVSARLLKEIENNLNLRNVPESEKVKIILAGYNSGITNLINARKMAAEAGIDYNNWDQLKNFGKVQNRETRAFVSGVYRKWNEYHLLSASSN